MKKTEYKTYLFELFDAPVDGVSYEERMACGIGACYGCVVKATVDSGYVRVCKDGPIFPLGVLKYES